MKPVNKLNVFEKFHYDEETMNKSKTWFEQQARLLSRQRMTPATILKNDPTALSTIIIPGQMYMFMYDAVGKETLKFFDRFPLVFPFRITNEHIYALNMHYLQYDLRLRLMKRLMQFKTDDKFNDHTKLKFSWQLISGMSKFKLAEPCVKQYRKDQVLTPFVKIDSKDWFTALMLPVESFTGANKSAVWSTTKKAIL